MSGEPNKTHHHTLKKILIKIIFTKNNIWKVKINSWSKDITHNHSSPQKKIEIGRSKNDIKQKKSK